MAANETKKNVPSIEGMENHVDTWRSIVKNKQRGIFSFDELVSIKLKTLKTRIYTDVEPTPAWKMRECVYNGVGDYDYLYDGWKEINPGDNWGGSGLSCFFKNSFDIPERFKGKRVFLNVYFGGDSLLSLNGVPYQGLDPFRNAVPLSECANGGEHFDVDVESYFVWHSNESTLKTLECSFLSVIDPEIEEVYWDIKAVYNALFMPGMDSSFMSVIRGSLQKALEHVDFNIADQDIFKAELKKCSQILHEEVYLNENFGSIGELSLIGNSHLDIVFMWSYKEFVRKLGRTHASMLRLMEQYDDFIFSQSQPVMYEDMKNYYPELFEQVKQRIKEGRWEVIGGMWCEPDCNLVSGESFVRQFLHGVRYAEENFGVTPKTCWLPDVFGNGYAMPQIMAKSGMEYFVTHKMGIWNDTNPWQYNTFWWEGPDGTRVFSIVPPTHFIGSMEPDSLKTNWIKYTDKTTIGESMYCYGWGDGGGGVDPEMLEYVKRYKKFPGLPKTRTSKIEDSLGRMKANATDKNIPVWKDELYLEAHRGVHTTKAMLKKLNRHCENYFRETEMYASIATKYGFTYPIEELNKAWKMILTNQFHDSLPGSHITEVYADLLAEYDKILEIGQKVHDEALACIAANIGAEASYGKAFAVFNSLAVSATNKVELDYEDAEIFDENGAKVATQCYTKPDGTKKLIFIAKDIPAVGYKVYFKKEGTVNAVKESTSKAIENAQFKLTFNEAAELVSVYDKINSREVLQDCGKGNVFRLFEDIPGNYEAWDIVATYVDREFDLVPGKIQSVQSGDVCTVVTIVKEVLKSKIEQNIIIYNDLDRIDFDTHINWQERQKLLKVFFDVDLQTKTYTRDIAYATIEGSSYRYNPYDKAKFEVSAHNWVDMSDDDYGVSILNDCKYGHEFDEHTMVVTLLKGPMHPDPESDLGDHYFTYSLYPHQGRWTQAKTLTRGLEINNPMSLVDLSENAKGDSSSSFMCLDVDSVNLEAIKRSEDNENEFIVRFVEKTGRRANATFTFFSDIKESSECDLIERNDTPAQHDGNKISFEIKPFEIKTFKLKI